MLGGGLKKSGAPVSSARFCVVVCAMAATDPAVTAANTQPAKPHNRTPFSAAACANALDDLRISLVVGRRRGWRRRGRRDRKGHPGIPAGGPVFRGELPIALEIEISLHLVGERNDEADLGTDACDLRLEAADAIARSAVAADLPVDVSNQSDLDLLGQELRRAPVEVHVRAVLVLGCRVDEIIGEAEHAGEFVSG